MTREVALGDLLADSAHRRLTAARVLARDIKPSDLPPLRQALQSESVVYVRTALNLAIKRASESASTAEPVDQHEYDIPPDVIARLRSEVSEEIAALILHEIASCVGLIASAAAREIPRYYDSTTQRHVETLKRVFRALEQLKFASAVPKPEEFDLSALIDEVVSNEIANRAVPVSLNGPKPMLITSDPALIRLAVSNGIRNSLEAVLDSTPSEPHWIIVTWGETDIDCWTSILDHGPGVTGPTESAFEIGKTTKTEHSGFGLAIARQAVETLGGSCTLEPVPDGGARLEIRWER